MNDLIIEYSISITTCLPECPSVDVTNELGELNLYSELSVPGRVIKKTNNIGGWCVGLCETRSNENFYKALECVTSWLEKNPTALGNDHQCSLTIGVFAPAGIFSAQILMFAENIKGLSAANMKLNIIFYPTQML